MLYYNAVKRQIALEGLLVDKTMFYILENLQSTLMKYIQRKNLDDWETKKYHVHKIRK